MVPELERMERDEFTIDVEGRDMLKQANDEEADKLAANIKLQNLGVELRSERVKAQCWDSMATAGKELHSLKSGVVVCNVPIAVRGEAAGKRLEKVLNLRKVELREPRWIAQRLNDATCARQKAEHRCCDMPIPLRALQCPCGLAHGG